MRLSNPVCIMAAAINSAPPTKANAVLAKPPSAIVRPSLVPYSFVGFDTLGDMPSRNAIKPRITAALEG